MSAEMEVDRGGGFEPHRITDLPYRRGISLFLDEGGNVVIDLLLHSGQFLHLKRLLRCSALGPDFFLLSYHIFWEKANICLILFLFFLPSLSSLEKRGETGKNVKNHLKCSGVCAIIKFCETDVAVGGLKIGGLHYECC